MNYIGILTFLLSLLLTYIFLPMLKELLLKSKLVCNNYKGVEIPTSMGLTFIFAQILTIGIIDMFLGYKDGFTIYYLLGFIFIGLLGLLDDMIGTDEYKGLKGHIGAFFKGKLTTGNIKASMGLFISIYISSFFSKNLGTLILNGVLVALFINLMNLFDLRPGRAGKTFFIISVVLIMSTKTNTYDHIFLGIYGILIPYMMLDLKAEVMMGDTGSNILGFTLGVYTMINFNIKVKIIILIVLILTHLLAEKKSFSEIIKNNKFLNYIDQIGR